MSYQQLFLKYTGLDPFTADEKELRARAEDHGVDDIKLNRRQWLDLLVSIVIQPGLPEECLTFVYDFPADQAALARVRQGDPPLAERFELFLGRTELANGYQELTNAREQKQRFDNENLKRKSGGKDVYEIDQHLIDALEYGLPECTGVALGVDRLLMLICGAESINEVTAFPFSRA